MVVDRIEGDFAVVEHRGEMIEIPLSELPENVREGDVLIRMNGGYSIYNVLSEEKRMEMAENLENLFKRKLK
ncbi:MAG: DUF3006 domain-containing protein [Ruminococcus sp.]|nr:DUF3006 domain-containing protein [Ruminococcus sp.]